jgi:hypothetical protein
VSGTILNPVSIVSIAGLPLLTNLFAFFSSFLNKPNSISTNASSLSLSFDLFFAGARSVSVIRGGEMAPNDPKKAVGGGGSGFFASLASSISNLGSAMTKSVNGLVPYEGLEVINPEGSTDDAEEEASRGRWKQEDRDGYWKMMQKYIGSDVTSMVTLPVIIFEPMTMLQKMAEVCAHDHI